MSEQHRPPQTDTVTVYEFEIFDQRRRAWAKAAQMGTLKAIAAASGVPLKSSALVVDAAKVGPDGLLRPPQAVGDNH